MPGFSSESASCFLVSKPENENNESGSRLHARDWRRIFLDLVSKPNIKCQKFLSRLNVRDWIGEIPIHVLNVFGVMRVPISFFRHGFFSQKFCPFCVSLRYAKGPWVTCDGFVSCYILKTSIFVSLPKLKTHFTQTPEHFSLNSFFLKLFISFESLLAFWLTLSELRIARDSCSW